MHACVRSNDKGRRAGKSGSREEDMVLGEENSRRIHASRSIQEPQCGGKRKTETSSKAARASEAGRTDEPTTSRLFSAATRDHSGFL